MNRKLDLPAGRRVRGGAGPMMDVWINEKTGDSRREPPVLVVSGAGLEPARLYK